MQSPSPCTAYKTATAFRSCETRPLFPLRRIVVVVDVNRVALEIPYSPYKAARNAPGVDFSSPGRLAWIFNKRKWDG